jgi:hypothetical protein
MGLVRLVQVCGSVDDTDLILLVFALLLFEIFKKTETKTPQKLFLTMFCELQKVVVFQVQQKLTRESTSLFVFLFVCSNILESFFN